MTLDEAVRDITKVGMSKSEARRIIGFYLLSLMKRSKPMVPIVCNCGNCKDSDWAKGMRVGICQYEKNLKKEIGL